MRTDLAASTKTLGEWLLAFAMTQAICLILNLYAFIDPSLLGYADNELGPIDLAGFASALIAAIAGFWTLRWIHDANARAQRLTDEMTMSPKWNVGVFFVPVADLWKPFQGVREIWAVSHDPVGWREHATPPLLRWWWGGWLAISVVAPLILNVLGRLDASGDLHIDPYPAITIGMSFLWVGASGLLWRVVTQLSRAQADSMMRMTFA